MTMKELELLRKKIDMVNIEILEALTRRAELIQAIGRLKTRMGLDLYDPVREMEMLEAVVRKSPGPFSVSTVKNLFKEIFKASLDLEEEDRRRTLLVRRASRDHETVIVVRDLVIDGSSFHIIAGPCAIESLDQIDTISRHLSSLGVRILRGGAFKPRTSPYSFQGLGEKGLKYMKTVGERYGMITVTEVMDVETIPLVSRFADILQVGTRNMHNFRLLEALGDQDKPVLLKRGFMATIEELLFAAEYIVSRGNDRVILCERGIRTFERFTRTTLDISAVALLKQETHLPVWVDVSHSAGRKDIVLPLAKAARAAGANGLMIEVHNNPPVALSDADQQLDLEEFKAFLEGFGTFSMP